MAFSMHASGERGVWLNSPAHQLIKQAHVHGNLESLVNIIAGILICQYGGAAPRLAKAASLLLIAGTLLHSGLFFLGGLGLTMLVRGAFFGPVLLIAGVAVTAILTYRCIGQAIDVNRNIM